MTSEPQHFDPCCKDMSTAMSFPSGRHFFVEDGVLKLTVGCWSIPFASARAPFGQRNNGETHLIADYLYAREQARQILGGVSIATLVRLEKAGALKPVRFCPSGW